MFIQSLGGGNVGRVDLQSFWRLSIKERLLLSLEQVENISYIRCVQTPFNCTLDDGVLLEIGL